MRTLNLEELSDQIRDYSSGIKYSERDHLEIKITQFFNFLREQPISKRIFQRIDEDFKELKSKLAEVRQSMNRKAYEDFTTTITTRELQGAFGYFLIYEKYQVKNKYSNHYINLSSDWYHPRGGGFDKYQEYFNTYFFDPFVDLIEWYLSESRVKSEVDYYSREEIELLDERFSELRIMIGKLEMGQEIVFNEANEIKELVRGLNKKNWKEIIKGKFVDLAFSEVISMETAEALIKVLTSE